MNAPQLHAGSWLCVFPITMHATARARHYQLALTLRLGLELPELLAVQELTSGVAPHIAALIMMCTPSTLAFAALAIATGSGLFGMMRCSSCSFT